MESVVIADPTGQTARADATPFRDLICDPYGRIFVNVGAIGSGVALSQPLYAQDDYAKVQSSNATDTSFPATVATVTTPTASASRAVITWAGRDSMRLVFFGTGSDNDTFDYRVVGWQKIATLWVPTAIVQGSATLSALVGVAAAAVIDTERFADTIDVDFGVGFPLNSPVADKNVASLEVGIGSYDYVEVLFDLTGATAANALYTTF